MTSPTHSIQLPCDLKKNCFPLFRLIHNVKSETNYKYTPNEEKLSIKRNIKPWQCIMLGWSKVGKQIN